MILEVRYPLLYIVDRSLYAPQISSCKAVIDCDVSTMFHIQCCMHGVPFYVVQHSSILTALTSRFYIVPVQLSFHLAT